MIIVNFSTENYSRPQHRLRLSLKDVPNLMFTKYEEINSPTHLESPYAFKIHAIEKAFEHDEVILWLDSSFWLVGDIKIIESIILNDGYFMSEAGAWVGDWCNHHTRDYFKLTDEESMVPGGFCMFSAGLLGLNKSSDLAMEFFNQWKVSALAGCFRGSFEDHRHDQTCGSIIASRLGMKFQRGGQYMSYIGPGYSTPEKQSIFYLQGMA